MKVKYIRRDIPEEISEAGGAYIQLVGKSTVGLAASVKEAIRSLHCVGEASLIEGYFFGLCRSVFAGIKADGCSRSIGDLRFFVTCGGTFDLEKGLDPAVNDVRINAQLVNGVVLDVSDWSFEDVTEGRVAFAIDGVSDGVTAGVVSNARAAEINGRDFPAEVRVAFTCGTKSVDVAASKITRTVSRIDVNASAFATLGAAEDGLPIVFTVKGAYHKATKTGVFHYTPPPVPSIVKMRQVGMASDDLFSFGTAGFTITGTNLSLAAGDKVTIELWDGTTQLASNEAAVASSTDTTIVNTAGCEDTSGVQPVQWEEKTAKLVVTKGGTRIEHPIVVNA